MQKLTCTGTLQQVFICLRARTQYPPSPYTVYVYTYLQREVGGGRVELERRLEEQQFIMLGRKYQHFLIISPVLKL
jgi:hypothetical protein